MERLGEHQKKFILVASVILLALLTVVFHFKFESRSLIIHLYYFPIILAAFWWRRGGLVVAASLVSFLILLNVIHAYAVDDLLRSACLLAVALIIDTTTNNLRFYRNRAINANNEITKIFDTSFNAMAVLDERQTIVRHNRAFAMLVGAEISTHTRCWQVMGSGNCNTLQCPFEWIKQNRASFKGDGVIVNKAGKSTTCMISAAAVNSEGDPLNILIELSDITELKQQQKKIAHYNKQLRSIASELSLAEERERRRLATDLHDGISQRLFVSNMKLAALEKSCKESRQLQQITEVRNDVELSLRESRTLIFELSPPVLYELGLEAALEWLCEKFTSEHNCKVQLVLEQSKTEQPQQTTDFEVQVFLFQAIRELLTNVTKHAHASFAQVRLRKGRTYLRCIVTDNGSGFDTGKLEPQDKGIAGFGLFNIKERLNYIEGSLIIESQPGNGTTITMLVPYTIYQSARIRRDNDGSENHVGG